MPVEIGGASIEPEDALVLDADEAVVVPAARIDEVRESSHARVERETAMPQRLKAGELSYDIYGMRDDDADAG